MVEGLELDESSICSFEAAFNKKGLYNEIRLCLRDEGMNQTFIWDTLVISHLYA